MTLEQILYHFAQCYAGPSTCAENGCTAPARHMPVIMFAVAGNHDRVWPSAILGYGVCSAHKRELRLVDVDTGTPTGIVSKVAKILHDSNQGSIDPERTNIAWVDLPLRN